MCFAGSTQSTNVMAPAGYDLKDSHTAVQTSTQPDPKAAEKPAESMLEPKAASPFFSGSTGLNVRSM